MTWYQIGLCSISGTIYMCSDKYPTLDEAKLDAEGMLSDNYNWVEAYIYEISSVVSTLRKKSVVEEVKE